MRKRSFKEGPILYLVATPIGNLEDISYRAVRILKEVNRIYAEDTRNSQVLLNHYDIKTELLSYHDFSSVEDAQKIVDFVAAGNDVALISDAGMPVISDPGFKLVEIAIQNGIAVSVIPGPSAFTTAFAASNLASPLLFYGFLKAKKEARKKELTDLKYLKATLAFYEAPHRIAETLEDILAILGDREIVLARELTKKFEEYIRGKASEVLAIAHELKGEMVLLVSGYVEDAYDINDRFKLIEEKIKLGIKSNEAIKEVASMLNINKKELYKEYLEYKQTEN